MKKIYDKFCELRDYRAPGTEAPKYTEAEAFALAVTTSPQRGEAEQCHDLATSAATRRVDRSEPWTDAQREKFRQDMKVRPRCEICYVPDGDRHFPGCSREMAAQHDDVVGDA